MHVSTLLTFKWYTDMIMPIAHDLELENIFAHADDAINSKMLITIYNYGSIRMTTTKSYPSWEDSTQFC